MIRTIEMYSVYVSVKANIVNAFAGTIWSRHATPSLPLAGKRVGALRDKTKQWLNRRLKLQGITQNHTHDLTHLLNASFRQNLLNCLYHVTWSVAVGNLGQRTYIYRFSHASTTS